MKKAVIVVLIAIMVMGTFGGLLLYVIPRKPADKSPFADIPRPNIKSRKYADFSGMDLSGWDLSGAGSSEQTSECLTYTFDSATKWPSAGKMPRGFSPGEAMALGKDLGLGLKRLHEQGVTGKGVSVAVIDKPVIRDHEAYSANLEYIEVKPDDAKTGKTSFHGAAVASILSGVFGVAPEARLYYFAVPGDPQPYAGYADAMNMLLRKQAGLALGDRIRVVVVSRGADSSDAGAKAWAEAIKKAEDQGIIVVYPGMPGLSFTGAGALPGRDRDDPASYREWSWTSAKKEIALKLEKSGARSFEAARKELKRLLTSNPDLNWLQAEAINTFIYMMEVAKADKTVTFDSYLWSMTAGYPDTVAVPVDFLTVANDKSGVSYTYYGAGGLTWGASYVAGMLALGCQVDPAATPKTMFDAIRSSASPFGQAGSGGKIVNPAAFVEALR